MINERELRHMAIETADLFPMLQEETWNNYHEIPGGRVTDVMSKFGIGRLNAITVCKCAMIILRNTDVQRGHKYAFHDLADAYKREYANKS